MFIFAWTCSVFSHPLHRHSGQPNKKAGLLGQSKEMETLRARNLTAFFKMKAEIQRDIELQSTLCKCKITDWSYYYLHPKSNWKRYPRSSSFLSVCLHKADPRRLTTQVKHARDKVMVVRLALEFFCPTLFVPPFQIPLPLTLEMNLLQISR